MEVSEVEAPTRAEIEVERRRVNLMAGLLFCLQKGHRIEVLLLLHDRGTVRWRDVKGTMYISDGTFRVACQELVDLGLARKIPIDPLKNSWKLTDFGCLIADVMQRAMRDIGTLIKSKHNNTGMK